MREKYLAQLGEKLGAPAEEFGIYSRPGGMSTAVSYSVSGGLGMFSNSEGKKASGGLPMNVILALTAAELVVFEMKAGMTGSLKLGEPLRRWPRSAVRAEIAGQSSTGARLRFTVDDGSFELDANKLPGMDIEWNLQLVNALAEAPPPPTPNLPPPGGALRHLRLPRPRRRGVASTLPLGRGGRRMAKGRAARIGVLLALVVLALGLFPSAAAAAPPTITFGIAPRPLSGSLFGVGQTNAFADFVCDRGRRLRGRELRGRRRAPRPDPCRGPLRRSAAHLRCRRLHGHRDAHRSAGQRQCGRGVRSHGQRRRHRSAARHRHPLAGARRSAVQPHAVRPGRLLVHLRRRSLQPVERAGGVGAVPHGRLRGRKPAPPSRAHLRGRRADRCCRRLRHPRHRRRPGFVVQGASRHLRGRGHSRARSHRRSSTDWGKWLVQGGRHGGDGGDGAGAGERSVDRRTGAGRGLRLPDDQRRDVRDVGGDVAHDLLVPDVGRDRERV